MSESDGRSVLVIAAGVSDLQPIIKNSDGERRRSTVGRNIRWLHQALLDRDLKAHISVAKADLELRECRLDLEPLRAIEGSNNADAIRLFTNGLHGDVAFERADDAETLRFVAPKLAGLWQRTRWERIRPVAIRIITTRRAASSSFGKGEPVALGAVLSKWFAEICPQADIREVAVLQGDETLEAESGTEQLDLPRAVVHRIDQCFLGLARDYGDAKVILAINGGMPPVKEYIAASARLYFRGRPIERSVHLRDRGETRQFVRPSVAEEARARLASLLHLRMGGFVEAYASAIEFHNSRDAASWVEPLRIAAGFLNSNRNLAFANTGNSGLDSFAALAALQTRRCLIPALRTEAALHAGHWPEAINWTMTLFDAAMLDAIEKTLPTGCRIADRERLIFWPLDADRPPRYLLEQPPRRQAVLEARSKNRPKEWQQLGLGVVYRFDALGAATPLWLDFVEEQSAQNKSPLRRLHVAMVKARNYRNLNTHNRLSESELQKACTLFRRKQLWAESTCDPGEAFLGRPSVEAVLQWLLGVASPKLLYLDLVRTLEARLLDHSMFNPDSAGASPPFVAT